MNTIHNLGIRQFTDIILLDILSGKVYPNHVAIILHVALLLHSKGIPPDPRPVGQDEPHITPAKPSQRLGESRKSAQDNTAALHIPPGKGEHAGI